MPQRFAPASRLGRHECRGTASPAYDRDQTLPEIERLSFHLRRDLRRVNHHDGIAVAPEHADRGNGARGQLFVERELGVAFGLASETD